MWNDSRFVWWFISLWFYEIFWWRIWCFIRLYLCQNFCLSLIGRSLIQFYFCFVRNFLWLLIGAFSLIHRGIYLGTLHLFELNYRLRWLCRFVRLFILYLIHLSFLFSCFCSQLSGSGLKLSNFSFHFNLMSFEFFLFCSFSLNMGTWIDLNNWLNRYRSKFRSKSLIFRYLRSSWYWRMNRGGNIRRNHRHNNIRLILLFLIVHRFCNYMVIFCAFTIIKYFG